MTSREIQRPICFNSMLRVPKDTWKIDRNSQLGSQYCVPAHTWFHVMSVVWSHIWPKSVTFWGLRRHNLVRISCLVSYLNRCKKDLPQMSSLPSSVVLGPILGLEISLLSNWFLTHTYRYVYLSARLSSAQSCGWTYFCNRFLREAIWFHEIFNAQSASVCIDQPYNDL